MISRNRSAPTTEAMSIEWTTSANRIVTCLYSAWASQSSTGEPQLWQNRAFSKGLVPHVCHAPKNFELPRPAARRLGAKAAALECDHTDNHLN
jgi:hypothetical protein